MENRVKDVVKQVFNNAGIKINGPNPWDLQVHNEDFYKRVIRDGGALSFGESYMDGWWDVEALDQMIAKILKVENRPKGWKSFMQYFFTFLDGLKKENVKDIHHHYDIGNDLFVNMLDKLMIYSCGYWKEAKTLDEAQEAKLDLICRKINLQPGQRILDIGCGWGGFAYFAAKKYGTTVVGITLSKDQVETGRVRNKGLPVEIRFQDYLTLDESEPFDHIISIGMFEHVGPKNYPTFMKIVRRCLKKDGLFLLHTIGGNISARHPHPWLHKYIFPNAILPSMKQITSALEGKFIVEDWHNFGLYYEKTLLAWFDNFHGNWNKLKEAYDDRFYRMWKFYLLSCAGFFKARKNQLWQIVMSKEGLSKPYVSVR